MTSSDAYVGRDADAEEPGRAAQPEAQRLIEPDGDGFFTLSTVGNDSYRPLCHAIGAPRLASDPRFPTALLREQHRAEVNAAIEAVTCGKTTREWVEILNSAGVPAGPIYKDGRDVRDPQVRETGIVQTLDHPKLGRVEILGQPITLSRTPAQFRTPSPNSVSTPTLC